MYLTPYQKLLKQIYVRENAAWRKRMWKDPSPCGKCSSETNLVITEEGLWLCEDCHKEFRAIAPVKTLKEKLDRLGAKYPTEEEFSRGEFSIKPLRKGKKINGLIAYKTMTWDYSSGKTGKKK